VEVKANKDGRIRLKAFNRSNNNSLINNINSPYTQGVGIFYRQEFNSFKELAHKFKESLKRKRKVSAPATGN
jgi:isocitrate dehydrogenase